MSFQSTYQAHENSQLVVGKNFESTFQKTNDVLNFINGHRVLFSFTRLNESSVSRRNFKKPQAISCLPSSLSTFTKSLFSEKFPCWADWLQHLQV